MSNEVFERVSSNLLFRHRFSCRATQGAWKKTGKALSSEFEIPHFGRFEGQEKFADFRVGWTPEGLFFDISVSGKSQSVWCRTTQILESDAIFVWIDTRNTQSIHRASRFCHWFVFLPSGGGAQRDSATASMLKINRAKENPKTFQMFRPNVAVKMKSNGYRMQFFVDGNSLTGWNTQDHRTLGFSYLVNDRELGTQTLATGTEFPMSSDPSLWHCMQLSE